MSAPRCPTLGERLAGHIREYDRAPAPQGGFVIRASGKLRGHPVVVLIMRAWSETP